MAAGARAPRPLTLHVFRHLPLVPMRSSQSQGFRLHFRQHVRAAARGERGSGSVGKPRTWTRAHRLGSGGKKEGAPGEVRPPARSRERASPPPGPRVRTPGPRPAPRLRAARRRLGGSGPSGGGARARGLGSGRAAAARARPPRARIRTRGAPARSAGGGERGGRGCGAAVAAAGRRGDSRPGRSAGLGIRRRLRRSPHFSPLRPFPAPLPGASSHK